MGYESYVMRHVHHAFSQKTTRWERFKIVLAAWVIGDQLWAKLWRERACMINWLSNENLFRKSVEPE